MADTPKTCVSKKVGFLLVGLEEKLPLCMTFTTSSYDRVTALTSVKQPNLLQTINIGDFNHWVFVRVAEPLFLVTEIVTEIFM